MSDEIKEILELIGNSYYYGNIAEEQKEKYCNYITNLQQENENLKDFNNKLQATKDRLDKYDRENQLEIDRLNNIINELEKHLHQEILDWQDANDLWTKAQVQEDKIVLDKLKKLKESNNE